MNKQLRLPVDIDLVRHPGQIVLRLVFHREGLCDWCLGVSLLKEGLIETLTLSGQLTKEAKVQFLMESKVGGTVGVSFKPDVIRVAMTNNSLDYVQRFFLKYYRDGVAEVDHLDLQAIDAETGNKEIYVTFRVPDARAPVTPQEAKKRLRGKP